MKQDQQPVHRWCSFSDSWSPTDVDKILSLLGVDNDEWIWDPFGGAGTTAVVAATRGICSITSDIDPLAVLVARTKTAPPSDHVIEAAEWQDDCSLARVVKYLGSRSALSRSRRIQTMRFMIASSLLRSKWHLGEPFNELRVRTEYSLLRSEMLREWCLRRPQASAQVFQSDFRAIVPLVRRSIKGNAVMVTSPPFLGSNDNPRLLKLERAIGITEKSSRKRKLKDIQSYLRMLNSIADVAAKVGCRAVAIELSARKRVGARGSEWPPAALAKRLEHMGYSTAISSFNTEKKDPSVLCLGIT